MTKPEAAQLMDLVQQIRQWAKDRDLIQYGPDDLDLLSEALNFADAIVQIAAPIRVRRPRRTP